MVDENDGKFLHRNRQGLSGLSYFVAEIEGENYLPFEASRVPVLDQVRSVNIFHWCSLLPGIHDGDTGCLKVTLIPGHYRHLMHHGGGCDQSIAIRAWVWHMECSATLSHHGVDRQDASGKRGQDVTIDPAAKDRALLRIAPLDQKSSYLQLQYGTTDKYRLAAGSACAHIL